MNEIEQRLQDLARLTEVALGSGVVRVESGVLIAEPSAGHVWTPAQEAVLKLVTAVPRAVVSERQILAAISQDKPLPEVLVLLVRRMESLCPGMLGSILLLDESGKILLAGAAPGLPAAYNSAVNGTPVGEGMGSCGTAAFRRETVVVSDIETSPLWEPFLHLTRAANVKACWSQPIISAQQEVVGTFGLYYREPRSPTPGELQTLRDMTDLAAVALSIWRTRDRLAKAVEQQSRIVAEFPAMVWRSDPTGICDSVSQDWTAFTGQTLDKATGDGWAACLHPDDRYPAQLAFAEAFAAGLPFEREFRLRRAGGEYSWVVNFGKPLHGLDGERRGYINTCFDVTARREADFRLLLAVQTAQLGLWDLNLTSGGLHFDQHCSAIVGYQNTEAQFSYEDFVSFLHEDDRPRVAHALALHLSGDAAAYECEYRILTAHGSYRWVRARGAVTHWNPEGQPIHMTGTLFDVHEHKLSVQALADTASRLQTVLTNSPAIIVTVDCQMRITFLSSDTQRSVIGRNPAEFCLPDSQDAMRSAIKDVLSDGLTRTIEVCALTNGGDYDWYATTIGPIHGGSEITGAILSSIIIADRRRAEDEARVMRERLELAIRGSEASLWDYDLRTRAENYSSRFFEMLGFPGDWVPSQVDFWESRIHPEDRPAVLASFDRHLANSTVYDVEYRMETRSGEYRWFNTRGQAIRDAQGTAYRMAGSTLDITNRKVAEGTIRQSEARYRLLFDSSPQPMFVFNPETRRIVAANAAACELYDYSRDSMLGLDITELGVVPDAVRHKRRDGRELAVRYREHVMQFEDHPARLALVTDMTRQLHLEQQVTQAQKMEAFGQLAGGVAHDFNNLLTVINGYSKMAIRKLVHSPAALRDVELVLGAGERAARLTKQLLAFARRQLIQPQRVAMGDLLDRSQVMLRSLLGESVKMAISYPDGLPDVLADPGQLEQVLINLVVNARDAMPRGGTLALTVSNESAFVRIDVSDTGAGIAPEDLSHIFEPFYTTKPVGKGTGLGLSTVYGIVTQAGGEVSVASVPGAGACFTVLLPAQSGETQARTRQPLIPGPVPRAHGTILVVEDQDGVREFLRLVLVGAGYQVLESRDGQEALALMAAQGSSIHLVLTDIVMPRMGGFELAEHLRSAYPATPVAYMSGYPDVDSRHPAPQTLLQKPFSEEALLDFVRQALSM